MVSTLIGRTGCQQSASNTELQGIAGELHLMTADAEGDKKFSPLNSRAKQDDWAEPAEKSTATKD